MAGLTVPADFHIYVKTLAGRDSGSVDNSVFR